MSNLKYRPDIDGLRALAVLVIIIFHFDKTLLAGGFIGVDVFFVISGFIITATIYPQIKSKSFSFSDFYQKRIKRILPLYYLVALTSLIVAYILFTPNDLVSFGGSLRYTSSLISNIYFERNIGYFSSASETMPLLNVWSLSVEEQFYLFWPFILLIIVRFISENVAIAVFIAMLVGMVAYSHFLAITSPSEAYFLIQSRGFELLIGAMLAMGSITLQQKGIEYSLRTYQIAGLIGVALVLIMLNFLDESSFFPSYNAVVVCLGVALIIFSSSNNQTYLNKVLSTPCLVAVGRISYALYLWHWPIQSFYRYYYADFGLKGFIICSVLTVLFSVTSFIVIEKPLRQIKCKKRVVYIFYFFLPIAVLFMISNSIENNKGYPKRFSGSALELYLSSMSDFENQLNKPALMEGFEPFSPIVIGNQSAIKPSAYIWGDSHGQHFRGFVDELGKEYGFTALFSGEGGCPPIANGWINRNGKPRRKCEISNKVTLDHILASDVKVVFLGARWAIYAQSTLTKNEQDYYIYLGDELDQSESIENNRRVLSLGLEKTISTLIAHGKTPIIFSQIPSYPFNPSNCLFKKITVKSMANLSCDTDKQVFDERYHFASELLNSIKMKYPQTIIIDVQPIVCREHTCVSQLGGQLLYKDNDHLNSQGARKLHEEYMKTPSADELKQRLQKISHQS